MKVSVILPTYRRESELKRALESLALQGFNDFEIIVVDDNVESSWNSRVEKIVKTFVENYNISLVYVSNHPNLGSAKCRNAGINAASGEYITFLDDDDVYLPSKISRQYDFMKNGGFDYSITDLDLYYDNEKLSEHRKRDYIKKTGADSLIKYHLMHHITGTDTMMFKADYLRKIGCFAPIDIGDEFYLMQRAIEGGGNFG